MRKSIGQRGFTLIEIISVFVVMSIIGVIAGMSLLKISEGFVFAKRNAATAQKGQIAMTRLLKELDSVKQVTADTWTTILAGDASSITLRRKAGAVITTFVISLSGGNLQIDNDILVDNVSAFELKYYNDYNGSASPYSPATELIEINLRLTGADNVISEFTNRVSL